MKLSLFDLHCDTALELYRRNLSLDDSPLAVSLKKASVFEEYIQVMAHWTPTELSDGCGWLQLKQVRKNLLCDKSVLSGKANVARQCPERPFPPTLLLSLEDARILEGRLERVNELDEMGFSIVTPLWGGISCIGGAHDVKEGLTVFGKEALTLMAEKGMILDVSHASERSFEEILEISQKKGIPPIASHSNAYALSRVSRNLRDGQIDAILAAKGLIGINLYTRFLRDTSTASVTDVLRHVEYFLSRGAERALCLGCDFDGAVTPSELSDVSALPSIAEHLLQCNYSEALVRSLFFENAYAFAKKYIHQ